MLARGGVLPSSVHDVGGDVEADQVVEVPQNQVKGVQLVRYPGIHKSDIEERSQDYSSQSSEQPESCLVMECFRWV